MHKSIIILVWNLNIYLQRSSLNTLRGKNRNMLMGTFSIVLYRWLECHLSKVCLTGPEAISIDVMKHCEAVASRDNKDVILGGYTME